MSQHELDQAIAGIREENPDQKVVREAAGRVFTKLFDSAFFPDSAGRIRSCSDFQALIPAYRNRTLAPARAMLFSDHILQCVDCRRALQLADGQEPVAINRPVSAVPTKPSRRVSPLVWAAAATLVVGIVAGSLGARYELLPWQDRTRARVAEVEGALYRVSSLGSALVQAGAIITSGEDLRTASGSRAVLSLIGGGTLEIAERSDISLSRDWRETTVNLEQGRVIVQGHDPEAGKIFLSGAGVLVPVNRAVVSFDLGTKGARVAVAQGSAEVTQGKSSVRLAAGQQMATNGLQNVPIATQFAWSKNAGSYLALLSEFSTLQKQFQSIPSPGLRYSSNLAKYVPADAVLYAAIPNIGGTMVEAKRIFDERLAASSVLRNWWGQQSASRSADLDRLIAQIASVSQYLGNEIVLSVPASEKHGDAQPVLLAEVRNSGLPQFLQQSLPPALGVQVLTSMGDIPANSDGRLLIFVSNNVLIASTGAAQLKRAAELSLQPAGGTFTESPFYARIAKSYTAGAGYLFAVNLEQIVQKSVSNAKGQTLTGFENAQDLVLERRDVGGATDTRASLFFNGSRQGVASWLGAPGPMGSLEFVSPNASFASSFIVKSPRDIVTELIAFGTQNDPNFSQQLNSFESAAGVKLLDDVAAPFGRDVTFAVDGPLLPIPSWKLIIEVEDPARVQQTLQALIDRFNQLSPENQGQLLIASEQTNSRTFYSLGSSKLPNLAAYYTFVDGYLLAGPSEANLVEAIQNRQAGNMLVTSAAFRNQLPADNYTNFSAILYTNAGSALGPIAEQFKNTGSLNPAQQQAVSTLLANSGPGLICVYGEPDRIVAASRGSFLGFNLGTLAGLQQGQSLLPMLASGVRSVTGAPGEISRQQR